MKFRLLLFMVLGGLYLIVMGGKGIRDAAAFRKPQTMTCEQFTKSPPGEGWFKVTQCEIAVDEAVYMSEKPKYSSSTTDGDINKIKEVYIPVHPALNEGQEAKDNETVALVLRTEDPQIIETIKELYDRSFSGNKEQLEKWELAHINELLLKRDVFGMVQSGLDSDSSTRNEISKLHGTLVPNYAIIEEGRTPSMAGALGKFAGGILLLPLALLIARGTGTGFSRRKR